MIKWCMQNTWHAEMIGSVFKPVFKKKKKKWHPVPKAENSVATGSSFLLKESFGEVCIFWPFNI